MRNYAYVYSVGFARINIHAHSAWYFIFGRSPNKTSGAQVRTGSLAASVLLFATRKRVTRVKQT